MRSISVRAMQKIDRLATEKFSIPSLILMENAGRKIAEETLKYKPRSAAIFCGKGNNGGDGLVAARYLFNRGVPVTIICSGSFADSTADTKLNHKIDLHMKIPILSYKKNFKISEYSIVIDALLGTGSNGIVRGNIAVIIDKINKDAKRVISIDVPSGLNADTGKPLGTAVIADKTVTLAIPKKGLLNDSAKKYVGKLVVADIGIPRMLLNHVLS